MSDRQPNLAIWIGAIATLVLAALGILTYCGADNHNPDNDAATPALNSTTPSPSRPRSDTASWQKCTTTSGVQLDCSSESDQIRFNSDACSMETWIARSGLTDNAGVFSLDFTTGGAKDQCVVGPGHLARRAGATIDDLLEIDDPGSAPLRICMAASTEVSCAQDHQIELVTDWLYSRPGGDPALECERRAQAFTGRRLDATDQLGAVTITSSSGPERIRCGVESSERLRGSTYRLGGARPPVAG